MGLGACMKKFVILFVCLAVFITQSAYSLYSTTKNDSPSINTLINDIIYECNEKTNLTCSKCNQSIQLFVRPITKINEEQHLFCNDEESVCLGCCIFKTDAVHKAERCYNFEHGDRTMTYFLHETCYNKLHKEISQKIAILKSESTLQCYDCRIKFGTWMCLGTLGLLSVIGCFGLGLCLATI